MLFMPRVFTFKTPAAVEQEQIKAEFKRVGQTEASGELGGGRRVGCSVLALLNNQENPDTAHINVTFSYVKKFQENSWRTFNRLLAFLSKGTIQ